MLKLRLEAYLVALTLFGLGGCKTQPGNLPDGGAGSSGTLSITLSDDDWKTLKTMAPAAFPAVPADVTNRYADDPGARKLGERFFNDPEFSGALLDKDNDGGPNALGVKGETGKVSCAGCHMGNSGFSDTRSTFQEISLGTGWTKRRTPSLLNVGYEQLFTWAGRHTTLHSQIFGPIENPLEMNSSRLYVATRIADAYKEDYEEVFGAGSLDELQDAERFPRLDPARTGCQLLRAVDHPRDLPPSDLYECHGFPGDGAEYDALTEDDQELVTRVVVNFGKAIAAFERTMSCGPGRFDSFVHGDYDALTEREQKGLDIFLHSGKCVDCHSGPLLTDHKFHNVGVPQTVTSEGILNNNDRGAAADLEAGKADELGMFGPYSDGTDDRFPESIGEEMEGAFKTPGLRCVQGRPTYFHTGLATTLDSALSHFNRGGSPNGFSGKNELTPLGLTTSELRDLAAFLAALDATPPSKP
jgi:cytochrome c peroxidase